MDTITVSKEEYYELKADNRKLRESKWGYTALIILLIVYIFAHSSINPFTKVKSCPSCGEEYKKGEFVECPWCNTEVCENCSEIDVYEGEMKYIDFGIDGYYIINGFDYYRTIWEAAISKDIDEFNEIFEDHGYKLEKVD